MIHYIKRHLRIALCLAVLLQGCSKELEQVPESAVSPDQINAANISFFLNGLYRRSIPEINNCFVNDIRGGNYTWTSVSGRSGIWGTLLTGDNIDDRSVFSQTIWAHAYQNIYNANVILEAHQRIDNQGSLNPVKGEASYLRAWLYYQLVTNFGGVPLVLSNTVENIPKNPETEVWDQILSDLDVAIANASPFSKTRFKKASAEAAKALKCRVLIARGRGAEAAALAQTLINGMGLSLDADYGRIFRNTESSTEVIFAFDNLKTEHNVRFSSLFWPYGTTWPGAYSVQPSDYAVNNLFGPGDVRKDINIQRINNSDGSFNMIVSKFWDVQPIIVSRIAELYLICAEGFGRSNGLSYLNTLRQKRGLAALSAGDLPTDDSYLTAVLEERRRELYSENFLFFDLVRTGRALALPNVLRAERYVLPIPGSQITLSKGVLKQNQGY